MPGSGCGQFCNARGDSGPCAALDGGRYADGTCCCPPVPGSGCGGFCAPDPSVNVQYSQIVNATLRWWALNYTGYATWHCHFVNHEDRGCMSWSSICDPDVDECSFSAQPIVFSDAIAEEE